MKISAAETITKIVETVRCIKDEDLIQPVSVISPNVSMNYSINRALLEANRPLLNVRVETFFQHIARVVEPVLLNGGIPLLSRDQAHFFIRDAIARLDLDYFKTAADFSSYTYYFYRVINDLRLGVPESKIHSSLEKLGNKGKKLISSRNHLRMQR